MTDDAERIRGENATLTPLFVGMGVCVLLAVAGAVYDIHPALNLGFWGLQGVPRQIGLVLTRSILIAILVWAVTWFGFVQGKSRASPDGYFAALMGVTLATALVGAVIGAFLTVGPALVHQYGAGARAASAQRLARSANARAFEAELAGVYGRGLLDPASMTSSHDLAPLKAKLAQARAALVRHQATDADLDRQARGSLKAREDVADYDAALASARPVFAEYWRLNGVSLSEMDGLAADLDHARGWQVQGGRSFLFSRADDKAKFDRHMQALRRVSQSLDGQRFVVLGFTAPRPAAAEEEP